MTKKRSAIIAAIISLLFPGLGHIYSGSPKRGIILYTLSWILLIVVILSGVLSTFKGLVVFICLGIGYIIFIAVDAFLIARKQTDYELKSYNKWYIYLIYAIFVLFIPEIIFPITQNLGYKPYHIPAGSMIPTLNIGDQIMVDMKHYKKNHPKRGDIIVFELPEDEDEPERKGLYSIKRVIGLPGDIIDIKGRGLIINNKKVDQQFLSAFSLINNELSINADKYLETVSDRNFEVIYVKGLDSMIKGKLEYPITVPENHLFILGDNRDNSYDSRFWKFLPKENILGKPKYIYYSSESERIGTEVE